MIVVEINSTASGCYAVTWRTRDKALFDATRGAFNTFIPPRSTRFDPAARAWRVSPDAGECLRWFTNFMVERYDAEVIGWDGEDGLCGDKDDTLGAAFHTLHLRPTAPETVIRASYRALAQAHHPDRPGGSTERMQIINTAYERIMKSLPGVGRAAA